MTELELRVLPSLSNVDEASWVRLTAEQGVDSPFLSWRFLEGLERTGCVTPERGWVPCHLTAWADGALVAAAPAYVKNDGMGDFSRDWALGDALRQLGSHLYPKLVIGVPFSPVSGRRFLHGPELELEQAVAALVALAQEVCRQNNVTNVQVLYCGKEEAAALRRLGFAPRSLIQYHWHNYDYQHPDDWLARLKSKKRTQARRERRAPAEQGLRLHTVRGDELRAAPQQWAEIAHQLYRTTCEKYMWGGAYLNADFFLHLFSELTEHVELVLARREDARLSSPIAGAINLATATHLYGRYWGCHEELPFLHFNVCLYHSIDECIERGIQVFEGGAGGEHKIARGFEPSIVHCANWFANERVHQLLGDALERDSAARHAQVEHWRASKGLE